MRKVLVYDSIVEGHHAQYISYLLDYAVENADSDLQLVICAPERLNRFIDVSRYHSNSQIFFDLRDFAGNNGSRKLTADENIQILKGLVAYHQATEILLMYLDGLFKPIAKHFKSSDCTLKGIYFSNFIRWNDPNLSLAKKAKQLFRFKASSYYWLVKTSEKVNTVFILADHWAVRRLGRLPLLKRTFHYVPEPVARYSEATLNNYPVRGRHGISNEAKVFLITGALAPRKNIVRILDAVQKAATEQRHGLHVLIAGPIQPGLSDAFKQEILQKAAEANATGIIKVSYEDRTLTDEELNAYVYASDFVCIPYWGFYNASAIMVQSVFSNKPLLAPNTGYCAEIVETYSFGVCVNPYDVESMTDGVRQLLKGYALTEANKQQFLNAYKPYPGDFARILLDSSDKKVKL